MDELMVSLGHRMVRSAVDFVVLFQSREEADQVLATIRRWVEGQRPSPQTSHHERAATVDPESWLNSPLDNLLPVAR